MSHEHVPSCCSADTTPSAVSSSVASIAIATRRTDVRVRVLRRAGCLDDTDEQATTPALPDYSCG